MAKKENESTDGEYSSQGNQVEEDTEDDGYNDEDEDFDSEPEEPSKKRAAPQKKSAPKSPKKTKVSSSAATKKSAGKKTKEEKGVKKELTEKQGYEVVLRYINEQNKPFNALTIFENLHKEVKKAYVVRILAQLAQDGKIVEKEYGKSKVYFADQSQFPEIDEAEFQKMDQEISALEEEEKSLQSEVGMLKNELKELDSALSEAELEKGIAEMTANIKRMEERVASLQSADVIDPAELANLRSEIARAEKIWRQRRSQCREVIGSMAEGMDKGDREVMEMIGLETEEELGIPLPFKR